MPGNLKSMAQKVAQAASRSQELRTGLAPSSVTTVLSEGVLVITLLGALTPAEQSLAANPAGAEKIQEFHRQLFLISSDDMRHEITEITGVQIQEAGAELGTDHGTMIHPLSDATMVQSFQLAGPLDTESFNRIPVVDKPVA